MNRWPGRIRGSNWGRALVLSLIAVGVLIVLEGAAWFLTDAGTSIAGEKRSSVTSFAWSDEEQMGMATFWHARLGSRSAPEFAFALIGPDHAGPPRLTAWEWKTPTPRRVHVGAHGRLALACEEGSLYLLDGIATDSTPDFIGRHPEGEPQALADAAEGTILVTHGSDFLCAWDVPTKNLLWPAAAAGIESIGVHPEKAELLCARKDGEVEVRDVHSGVVLRKVAVGDRAMTALTVFPNGQQVASVIQNEELVVWEFSTGQRIWSAPLIAAAGESLSVSHDGRWLAVGALAAGESRIIRFDAKDGASQVLDVNHSRPIQGTRFTRGGQLFSWSADGTVRLCNLEPFSEVAQWSPLDALRRR